MKSKVWILGVAVSMLLTVASGSSFAQCGGGMHSGGHSSHAEPASSKAKTIVYPIDYCIVSGEKLGDMGEPVKHEYKDRTVYFCCKGCIKKFEAEPAKYLAALDAAIASADAVKSEPATAAKPVVPAAATDTTTSRTTTTLTTLDWCIVSGETLGEMGKSVPYKYEDREITLCCKGCIKEFEKTPAAYLAKLDSALAGQITRPMEAEDATKAHDEGGSHH